MFLKNQIKSFLGKDNVDRINNIRAPLRIGVHRAARLASSFHPSCSTWKFFDRRNHVFFGYYDVSPFSHDEKLLLAMHVPHKNIPLRSPLEIAVGYYDLTEKNSLCVEIGKTSTWCWQQGCRLQWFPETSDSEILYNRIVDGKYGCVIQDIRSKKIIRSLQRPIYTVSRDGRWGLSLNFSRLHRLRPGYGYTHFPDETEGQRAPGDDGIWRIDMNSGGEEFLFSIEEITAFDPLESMNGAEHYFNHILFNPAGTRFMFFHIWLKDGKRFVRLITCNPDGNERYALVNEGHVSHYTWKSNNELLAYSTHKDTGTNYHLYRDETGEREIVGEGVLTGDGHPSYSPDASLLLTDTYHDKYREQHVLIYRLENEELVSLGSFYGPPEFRGEVRCDLHPRWSPSGKYICIDTPYKGKRAMFLIEPADI
jgi:hypothetical protein